MGGTQISISIVRYRPGDVGGTTGYPAAIKYDSQSTLLLKGAEKNISKTCVHWTESNFMHGFVY
jgi:hypothetical protein